MSTNYALKVSFVVTFYNDHNDGAEHFILNKNVEEHVGCATESITSKECGATWKKAISTCCAGFTCNGRSKKCVKA